MFWINLQQSFVIDELLIEFRGLNKHKFSEFNHLAIKIEKKLGIGIKLYYSEFNFSMHWAPGNSKFLTFLFFKCIFCCKIKTDYANKTVERFQKHSSKLACQVFWLA